jgi:dolichol-phosphate mannosyltransferase
MSVLPQQPGWLLPRALVKRTAIIWSQRAFPAPALVARDHGRRFWVGLVSLALVVGLLVLPRRSFPLFEPDEGRRAEIGREILVNGDWVICTLNNQPYYDKPPLFHWLLALSFTFFGTNEAAARLVPALATLLTVLATFMLGRRLVGHRAALLGTLALTLMVGYGVTGRLVGMDGTLTLFVTVAVLAAHEALEGPRVRWGWWCLAAGCCGLGALTKGPVALVLLALPLVPHVVLNPALVRPRLGHYLVFFAIVGAVVAPWLILVLVRDPQLLYEFLIYHNVQRFTAGIAHEESWWFYLPVLAVACLPWSPLLPFCLGHLMRGTESAQRRRPLGFLLLWGLGCVLFFSLSRGKLPLYVMPALPAFALLTGWYLEQVLWSGAVGRAWQLVRGAVPRLMLVILGASWAVACYRAWEIGLVSARSWGLVTLATAGALGASWLPRWRRPALVAWGCCAVGALAAELDMLHRLTPALATHKAPLAATEELKRLVHGGQMAVALPGQLWASFTFACRGEVMDTDPATITDVLAFLKRHNRAIVILMEDASVTRLREQAPADYRFTLLRVTDKGTIFLVRHDDR